MWEKPKGGWGALTHHHPADGPTLRWGNLRLLLIGHCLWVLVLPYRSHESKWCYIGRSDRKSTRRVWWRWVESKGLGSESHLATEARCHHCPIYGSDVHILSSGWRIDDDTPQHHPFYGYQHTCHFLSSHTASQVQLASIMWCALRLRVYPSLSASRSLGPWDFWWYCRHRTPWDGVPLPSL